MVALGESSLRTFTIDNIEERSLYAFEGEDFRNKQQEVGLSWIGWFVNKNRKYELVVGTKKAGEIA